MKVRVRHSKLGKVRFTSHRDSARHWERALRKAGLPVATSSGFSPRPRMAFGLALPTAAESLAEYLDIDLVDDLDVADETIAAGLGVRMTEALPAGYEVLRVAVLDAGHQPSLQEDVIACSWTIALSEEATAPAAAAVAATLAASSLLIERERKGNRRIDDVRPAIETLEADPAAGQLRVTLSTTSRGLRPAELLAVLFPALDPFDSGRRVLRTHQWIERDGERRELLPLTATCPAGEAVA